MLIRVMYHSEKGNTEKVAVAIATATGVRSEKITDKGVNADLLFLGDGVYDNKPADITMSFIDKLDANTVKLVAVFGTYHNNKSAMVQMIEALKKKGIKVFEDGFSCKCQYGVFFNSNHPDDKDLNNAIQFANRAIAYAKNNK